MMMSPCHNIPVMQTNVFVVRGEETTLEAMAFCCPMDSYRKICWKPVSVRYKNWRGDMVDSWFKTYKGCTVTEDQWVALSSSGPYYGMVGFGYYLEILPDDSWKAHPGNRSRSAELTASQPRLELPIQPVAPQKEEPTHPALSAKVTSHGYERIDRLAGNAYVKEEDDSVPF